MSFRRALWVAGVVAMSLAAPAIVQAQGDYLDVYIVKVKPEKTTEFNTLAKKVAEANRRNNGDRWLGMEIVYGEGDTVQFVSTRQDYAETDKASAAFMGALSKAYGKDGAEKMLRDWENCLAGSRSELRRRRWDLSRKAPADEAAYAKLIGEGRLLRTTAVHVRPGRAVEFEALLKEAKEAGEKNANTQPVLVSQTVEGGKGTTFYVSTLRTSIGGFDKNPTTREILGEEGYKKYLQVNAEVVEGTESALYRFSPEISSPPEDVAKVASDFWHPKPVVAAASPKAKAPAVQPAAAKEAAKKP